MKNLIVLTMLIIAASSSAFAQTKAGKKDTIQHTTGFYSCPMHPNVKMDKPGKCSVCGMDLVFSKKEQLKREVTKTYNCPVHTDVVSDHPGKCPKCQSKLVVNRSGSKQGTVVYTCGIHPDVVSDKSGNCPICGMALVEKNKKTKTKTNP